MTDILQRSDIETLLKHFYQQAMTDPLIGFFFTELSTFSIAEHLPNVTDFWQQQLLGGTSYKGRNFEVHRDLNQHTAFNEHHFQRWLRLFTQSIDQLYAGPIADTAKQRATAIAQSMQQALAAQERRPGNSELQFYQP